MSVGTKHRQQLTAELCKRHLRESNADQLGLVEEFITEFEGRGKEQDPVRWSKFADIKGREKEMLERLDAAFAQWLNPA